MDKTKIMTHGSFFSGIGGFDLAAEWIGWTNKFHCEIDPFCQRVLNHYWPDAELFENIKTSDFKKYENKIDVISGGFPCQPYSVAGLRKGKEDERHLWPFMLNGIRTIKPRYVVGENVLGLSTWNDGLVLEEVCVDLENEGYEVQPIVIPAAGVGAPHKRDRIFIVGSKAAITNTNNAREYASERNNLENWEEGSEKWEDAQYEFSGHGNQGVVTNSNNKGLQRSEKFRSVGEIWERQNKLPTRFLRTNWEEFPTQSPICTGDDGFPSELDGITVSKWKKQTIMAAGNAIVPNIAYHIFQVIEQIENEFHNR
jgi:DNA (cytosine-5)-methyltransferase 1